MKDQNTIDDEPQGRKWNRVHNQKCFNELMYIRQQVLEYLPLLRRENENV